MSDVASQVGALAAAELPLAAGLEAYSREATSWRVRSALRQLSHAVAAGQPMHEALGSVTGTSAYLRGLFAAGVESGRLSNLIERHMACLQRTRDVRMRVQMAMFYPAVLMVVAALVFFVLLAWPVPMLKSIFNDFGVPLPRVTLAILDVSDGAVEVVEHWGIALSVLCLLIVLLISLRFFPGRAGRVRAFQRLPLVGAASRHVALSEFCSLLSILVESRLPLPTALRLTAQVVRDPNCAQGAERLARAVESGGAADDEIRRLPNFPRSLATLFRWSSRSDALAQGLGATGELFAVQARVESGVFGIILQPMILLLLGGGSVFVALSLLWPLFTLLGELA